MIPIMEWDFERVCRLCTKAGAGLQPIFVETSSLCSKIKEISPKLEFLEGDGLPAQICEKCLEQVDICCNFRLQCEEADAVFRHYLSSRLNNQEILHKSHATDDDFGKVLKEETVICILEELKQEPTSSSLEYGEEPSENHKEEVTSSKSIGFEIESEIKTDAMVFASELNQEQDTSNEAELGEQLVGGNKEDVEVYNKKMCGSNKLECIESNNYKCMTCSEIFTSNESQEQHKCPTPFRCLICNMTLSSEVDLRAHMSKHKNEPCRLCGKTFTKKRCYLAHLRTHIGLGYRCDNCSKLFPSLTALNIHYRKHTREKPYICEFCGERFMHNQGRNIHLLKHTGERLFQCPMCLKSFSHKITLQNHIRTHTGEKPYMCDICGNHFRDPSGLWHHTNSKHTQKEKKFKCSLCPKEYANNSDLKVHLRMHTGERPFECEICGKAFTQRHLLTKHIRIHTGEKSFDCTICNKTFSTSSSRSRHIRIHTGETPYACATCDKAFSLRRDLVNHVTKFHH